MEDFGIDDRRLRREAERLELEECAVLDVLNGVEREIEEVARTAGRIEDPDPPETIEEGLANADGRIERFDTAGRALRLRRLDVPSRRPMMRAFASSHSRASGRTITGSTICMIFSGGV